MGNFYQKDWILFQEIANEGGKIPVEMKQTVIKEGDMEENAHIPYIQETPKGYLVKIGKNKFHGNDAEHHENFVQLIVDDSLVLTKYFKIGEVLEYEFYAPHGKKVEALAFCNLHGLWKNTL